MSAKPTLITRVQHLPHVLEIRLNRPKKRNALSPDMFHQLRDCVQSLIDDNAGDVRAIVLTGEGPTFCAGIDVMSLGQVLQPPGGEDDSAPPLDAARKAIQVRRGLIKIQDCMSVFERVNIPVIAAVHGMCVGAGVDLIAACDVRYATQDAVFNIKEVDLAIAADIGTLQRVPEIVGSQSLVREWAFTARDIPSGEALASGLVSRLFASREELLAGALALAALIALKSPVAVHGTKEALTYAKRRQHQLGLEHMAFMNAALLQTDDLAKAVEASFAGKGAKPATFSKL
jgi:delta(3,5)-delta(2,4)-dienoyl-CoA isomerase